MNIKHPDLIAGAALPDELLSRKRLIRRWRHGSDSFFWRQEREGLLRPVCHAGLIRYHWHDVLRFEGGLPPENMSADYLHDLMTDDMVAAVCACAATTILDAARSGRLPARRVGRVWRFVPQEVARWQQARWTRRGAPMNANPRKTGPSPPDE